MFDVNSVCKYYDLGNEKKWKKVGEFMYKRKYSNGEVLDEEYRVYINEYGDVLRREGLCVEWYVIIDSRGWIIRWVDDDSRVICMIEDWCEKNLYELFEKSEVSFDKLKRIEKKLEEKGLSYKEIDEIIWKYE